MAFVHNHGLARLWVVLIVALGVILGCALAAVAIHYVRKPFALRGAVIQQNEDPKRQSPIIDVSIDSANRAAAPTKSDFSGYFKLVLRPGVKRGDPITIQFRHPDYQPFDLKDVVSDKVYVVRLVPLHPHDDLEEKPGQPEAAISNIFVRYTIETSAEVNIGTGVTIFQVVNRANISCDHTTLCSPDNRWKAAIGGAALDAGQGNIFENARVSCIAGPCPFTKIESDNFSHGGRNISVTVRGWADTTTFLFQAEVFRQEISDIVRESYPVIFGRALNFTLPAGARGPTLEAEVAGMHIVFPLAPSPTLSWSVCNVKAGRDQSKSYRCELRPGYRFK